ncbi:hypothetical protein E3U43_019888 [Larimichthys crocea]|uniref:Uncharacterized protein n=1 Tax=Larimichthys crocea TaxID=215358 RepID=A0ACD3QUV4_LARCR|nr:hypothetical protein E3U43_019888 [Larimichthys crocea]
MRHYTTHICKVIFVQEISEFPAGVLKVSITSPCLMENAGQIPCLVSTGWSKVKSTCLSLTALVSELMFLKLGVLCRSNSCSVDAPQHLWKQQDEENIKNNTVQANGQIQSPTDFTSTKDASSSGQRVTEDRPD